MTNLQAEGFATSCDVDVLGNDARENHGADEKNGTGTPYIVRPEKSGADGSADDIPSHLVDLTSIGLTGVAEAPASDSAFLQTIRRILHEAERPDEAIAGFQSSI